MNSSSYDSNCSNKLRKLRVHVWILKVGFGETKVQLLNKFLEIKMKLTLLNYDYVCDL